jgi:hypothetical protein
VNLSGPGALSGSMEKMMLLISSSEKGFMSVELLFLLTSDQMCERKFEITSSELEPSSL